MENVYDVQQLLKRFGIIVYVGVRLYDIEMIQIELEQLYQMNLLDESCYHNAQSILKHEHRVEEKRLNKENLKWGKN